MEKTISEMLREYNALVTAAVASGLAYRERKCFKDRNDATKSLGMIQSSMRAAQESAGQRRLRESGQAETIRQQVLADQATAAAAVAQPNPTQPVAAAAPAQNTEKVSTIMARKKKEKAESNGGGKRGREAAFKDDMKIAVLAEKNPKREGTRGHAVFGGYRNGMLVSTFVEKTGDRGEAMANLRYDASKGFISVA